MPEYDVNLAERLGADELSSGDQLRAYYDALNRYIMVYGYQSGAFSGPDTTYFLTGQDSEDASIRTNPLTQFNLKVEYPWELARMLHEETYQEIRDNLRDKRVDLSRYKEAFSYWLDYLAAHHVHVNISRWDSLEAVADKINNAVYETKIKENKLEEVKEQQAKQKQASESDSKSSNVYSNTDDVSNDLMKRKIDSENALGKEVAVAGLVLAHAAATRAALLGKETTEKRMSYDDNLRRLRGLPPLNKDEDTKVAVAGKKKNLVFSDEFVLAYKKREEERNSGYQHVSPVDA